MAPRKCQTVTKHRRRTKAAACCLLLWLIPLTGFTSWQGTLEDGSGIQVDPYSHRATIASGPSAGRQLWDGVHRLSDGSTVTIRSGVMVPTEQSIKHDPGIHQAQAVAPEPSRPMPAGTRDNPCDHLVLRCCGLHNECQNRSACGLAQQLRALQRKAVATDPAGYRWATGQCRQAMTDPEHFGTCEYAVEVLAAPCHFLFQQVCGPSTRCASSASCRMAARLRHHQARQVANGQPLDAGLKNQCMQMLLEHASFPPCR